MMEYPIKYYICSICGISCPCYCALGGDAPDSCILGNHEVAWIEIDKEQMP